MEDEFEASLNGSGLVRLTSNRERAQREEGLALLGLEQPFVRSLLEKMQSLPASERAVIARNGHSGYLTIWAVTIRGKSGHVKQSIVKLALASKGQRMAALEALPLDRLNPPTAHGIEPVARRPLEAILTKHAPGVLHRDLEYRGNLSEGTWYSSRLLGLLFLP